MGKIIDVGRGRKDGMWGRMGGLEAKSETHPYFHASRVTDRFLIWQGCWGVGSLMGP